MNPAVFSNLAYEMTKSGSKEKRLGRINKKLEGTNYKAISGNRDMVVFQNDQDKTNHIAHRGTSLKGKKWKSDIGADALIGLGLEKYSKEFKKRTKQTKDYVKQIPDDYKLNMSGHSLGGMTIVDAARNKTVREKLNRLDTFNAAQSPLTKAHTRKKERDELDNKVFHHRTHNDIVSKAGHNIGTVLEYKEKTLQKNKLLKKIPEHLQNVFTTVDQLNTHSLSQFL